MNTTLTVLIVLGLGATLAVLGVGMVAMLRGGAFNAKWGNKLMRWRLVLQALTIGLIVVAFMILKD
jgi:hypothetical protein